MNIDINDCIEIICSALANKYYDLSGIHIHEVVQLAWDRISGASSEACIMDYIARVDKPSQDIHNHVSALLLIYKFWSKSIPKKFRPILNIHSCLVGGNDFVKYREAMFVKDYGENVEIPVSEIKIRLDCLENLILYLSNTQSSSSVYAKAAQLAYIFLEIIRIHPFVDGNGRVARLSVLYLLSRWNMKPIFIPKIRNDSAWKLALTTAIEGDYSLLVCDIYKRLERL